MQSLSQVFLYYNETPYEVTEFYYLQKKKKKVVFAAKGNYEDLLLPFS